MKRPTTGTNFDALIAGRALTLSAWKGDVDYLGLLVFLCFCSPKFRQWALKMISVVKDDSCKPR